MASYADESIEVGAGTCWVRICDAEPNIFLLRLRAIAPKPPDFAPFEPLGDSFDWFALFDLALSANCKSARKGLANELANLELLEPLPPELLPDDVEAPLPFCE